MPVLGGLPSIPSASCPSAAAALAAGGLGPACQVAAGVSGASGSVVSQAAGFGVSTVFDALGSWVAQGATWLLDQIGGAVGSSSSVDLGASWFSAHYAEMATLAGVVIVPMLLMGIVQSVYRQNASMLMRSVLVNVPLAILLTAVAVKLVELGLTLVDDLSSAVASGAGLDGGHFLSAVTQPLSAAEAATPGGIPGLLVFLGGMIVVLGSLLVWIELLVRAAAVYVAVLFLPLALASLAWPAISHWCRRLVDTLVALVLSKFVIVAVLGLAAGALAGGTGSKPSGTPPGTAGGGGFTAVLGGGALLLLAGFSPWAVLRLLPFLEAGAIGHLEGVGQRARQSAVLPARILALDAMNVAARTALDGAGGRLLGGSAAASFGPGSTSRSIGSGGPGVGGATRSPGSPGPDPSGSGDGGSGDPSGGLESGVTAASATGVGSMIPLGHDIPRWETNREASAVTSPEEWSGSDRSTEGSSGLIPLPRATGTDVEHFLGYDDLGPRLIAGTRKARRAPDRDGDRSDPPTWDDRG
ncbi:MAG: hypothetical protein ACYCVN_09115 [Acidimicrobiales bacterium]